MKIGALPILSIGFAVGLIFWAFGYFHNWAPNLETAGKLKDAAVAYELEANRHDEAYKKYEQARAIVLEKSAEWQKYVARKTPSGDLGSGGINLGVSSWQLVNDVPKFTDSIQKAVNTQSRVGGVTVLQGLEVPSAGTDSKRILSDYFNYPALPYPVVMWNLGTIQVRGTYEQIKANAAAWKDMPNYLAMSDGLQITGVAPKLTGQYNVVLVGYIRGKTIFPAVLEGGGGTGANQNTAGGGGKPRMGN
ncbi:MAG: hypothetical protein ABL962_11825 [Fimbriimonadaceae bacterium]